MHRPSRLARIAVAIALSTTLASIGFAAAAQGTAPPDAPAPAAIRDTDQVVVRWTRADPGATRAQRLAALQDIGRMERLGRAAGMQAAFVRPFGPDGTVAVYRFERSLGVGANRTIAALNAVRGVALAEADPIATIDSLPSDPFASQLWGQLGPADGSSYGMDAVGAWATSTGVGAVVAVLDTGILTHADLAGQTVAGYDMITDSWTANDGDGRDADPSDPGDFVTAGEVIGHCSLRNSSWHGTHVTGIVAAIPNNSIGVFGAAPGAKVQPIRVLGRCGGSFSDIADGVTWASGGPVTGAPANATPADVVNMSLGSQVPCPAFLQAAIAGARSRGTLTVVSAGNSGLDASTQAPANCAGVVAVAAIESGGTRGIFSATSSSNYGATVDIAAPGVSIISTWNSGTTTPGAESYGTGSGTSQAAPHVSALAALLRASMPAAQPAALSRAITSSAKAFAADPAALGCPTVGCGAGIAAAPAALAFIATADLAAPVATVTRPSTPSKSPTLTFAVGFDEPVSGLVAADLSTDGTAAGCLIGTPAGAGDAWTVAVTGCGDGTITLTLAAQAVEDAVANVGPDAATASEAVTVDRTAPTSSGSVTVVATNGTSVSVNYAAGDGTGTGVASVQAFQSTSAALTSPQACGSVASGAATGTIICALPAVDATYRVFTRATDVVGNVEGIPGAADDTIVRDTLRPTATVVPAKTASNTRSVAYTITMGEAVTGLEERDLVLGGSATGCAPSGFAATASGATLTLAGCSDGSVTLGLAADAATDLAGNTGPAAQTNATPVVMDTVAPTVGALTITVRTAVALSGSSIPVKVAWAASDNAGGAGIATYALQRSADGGATWSTIASGLTTASRSTTVPSSGTTRFRVRAWDMAGNSALSGSTSRSGRLVQNSSSSVTYSSPWTLLYSTKFSAGSARYAMTSGRSASYTFTGRTIAFVSTRATSRGKVRIYVSGVLQATVDTYRSSTQYRSVVWQRTYATTVTKTIRIVVVGTMGRPRIDLDAFAVIK